MAKNLNAIAYPHVNDSYGRYMIKIYDEFFEACGSTRFGVIKFIRGTHENWYYDHLRKETGKWPSVNDQVWQDIPLGELIRNAYMGSQRAARNLMKRTHE